MSRALVTQDQLRSITQIARELGLTAAGINQVVQAVQNGIDLYEAIQPYTQLSLQEFQQRARSIVEAAQRRIGNAGARIETDYFRRGETIYDEYGNIESFIQGNQNPPRHQELANQHGEIQEMQYEDELSYHQQQRDISTEIFTGRFIIQFAT